MSFRKERKYWLTISDQKLLKKNLTLTGMKELHPARTINSCYFDNNTFSMFRNSEEGVLPRKKIRVRWYDNQSVSNKETKISSIEGRFKIIEKFSKLNFLKDNYNIQMIDSLYGILKPSLIVSYIREYYIIKDLRITFDSFINYTDLRRLSNTKYPDYNNVVEVKTPIYIADDYIEKIINHPTSRFSKYSRGLLIADRQI